MTNLAYERLHENLAKLKLNTIATILDNYLEIAANEGKTTIEIFDYLIDQEKHAKGCFIPGDKDEACWFSSEKET